MCPYSQAIKKANNTCQYHTKKKPNSVKDKRRLTYTHFQFQILSSSKSWLRAITFFLFVGTFFQYLLNQYFRTHQSSFSLKIHYMYISLYQRPELVALAVSVDTSRISHFFVLELKKTSRIGAQPLALEMKKGRGTEIRRRETPVGRKIKGAGDRDQVCCESLKSNLSED